MNNKQSKDHTELKERYVYAVVRKLPEKQRIDVAKELRSSIDDMTDEGQTMANALLSLGRPSDLADRYRGEPRYLIGPEFIDSYVKVICIVLPVVLVAVTIGKIISGLTEIDTHILTFFAEWLGSLISASLTAFAWVTIVFLIIERNKNRYERETFVPDNLPPLPKEGVNIRRSEAIAGIVFVIIGFAVLNFSPELLAVFNLSAGTKTTIINLELFNKYFIWFLNAALIIGLIREIAKLIVGRHTLKLSITNAVLALINIILIAIVLLHPSFINPNLNSDLADMGMVLDFNAFDMAQTGTRMVVMIMGLAYGLETVVAFYKTVKFDAILTLKRKKE